jgi:hypothetical protein
MVSGWRPDVPLGEMLLAGGSQKPHVSPFTEMLFWNSLLMPLTVYWQVMTHHWIWWMLQMPVNWRGSWRIDNSTEWPRYTTFWRCRRAVKTQVLYGKILGLKTRKWQPYDTIQILKRLTKHPGQPFHLMVWLNLNYWKDYHCQELGFQ